MNLESPVPSARHARLRLILYVAGIALALAALAAGIYGRFAGLGGRQLAVDEFYMTQSVRFILESGLPAFPDGGYYNRAIPFQYLTAALSLLLKDTVLAARIIAALFSLAGVALTYLYARRFLDRPLALAVAMALLVSSWDIEFARFARMYSMFQFMTLLYLLTLDEVFFRGRRGLRYAPHALAVLTILTHKLGILLIPLLFIPVVFGPGSDFFRSRSEAVRFVAAGIVTLILCYLLISIDVRHIGVSDAFPEGYSISAGPRWSTPAFPFWALSDHPLHNLATVIALMGVTALVLLGARRLGVAVKDTDIVLALSLISAAAHLLSVTILLLALLVFRYGILSAREHPTRTYPMLGLTLLIAAAWLVYAISDQEWVGLVDGGHFKLLWSLRRTFFGWPDFYTLHLIPWRREMPGLGLLIALALTYSVAVTLREPLPKLLRYPASILIIMILELSLLSPGSGTLRYSYFIYAAMLCAVAWAINDGAARIAGALRKNAITRSSWLAALLFLAAFASTGDFNPSHIAKITGPDASYRIGEFSDFTGHWYAREDYESPSSFVNGQRSEGDDSRVIAVALQPILYYLEGDRALYVNRAAPNYGDYSRAKGTVNIWTGDRLLGTDQEIRDYTAGAKVVWLIRNRSFMPIHPLEIEAVWAGRLLGHSKVFEGRDKRLEVVRIDLTGAE